MKNVNLIKCFKTFVICTFALMATLLFVTIQAAQAETLPSITEHNSPTGQQVLDGDDTLEIEAGGVISTTGIDAGVYMSGGKNEVNNHGSIITNGAAAPGIDSAGDNDSITNEGTGSITTNEQGSFGIYLENVGTTVNNYGTITTKKFYSHAIYSDSGILTGNITINNHGAIITEGGLSSGIHSLDDADYMIANYDRIETTGKNSHGIWVQSSNGNINKIYNYSTINVTGKNSLAILCGAGDEILYIFPDSMINAGIDLGEGYDIVNIYTGGSGNSDTLTFEGAEVINYAPVANAGANQKNAIVGNLIFLNGSGSSDQDGNSLTYKWEFISIPSGSRSILYDETTVAPSFVPDTYGTYEVSLTVNDGYVDSIPDTMKVVLPIIFKLVKQVDYITTEGNERYSDVWGEGDYAYIGTYPYGGEQGVGIIDISKPESAFLAAEFTTGNGTAFNDIKVHNGVGYFANDSGSGLYIVDLSNPTSPSLLSQITSAQGGFDYLHNVFIDGSFLYEADTRTAIVKVFDVSNPSDPTFVQDIVTTDSSDIHDITVLNNRLYTSGWGGTTDIYDVSDIATKAAVLLGSVDTGSNAHSNWVTSDGNILISAREIEDGDIRLYDISDPLNPGLLSTINRSSLGINAFSPHNPVLFNDDLLFVSWYEAGVIAIDISNPLNPKMLGSYDTYVSTDFGYHGNWGVYPMLGLRRVLLSDLKGGLFIIDASLLTADN